jgi:acyl-coenzyme A synthetase/AMP-(fatty) acid ligase/3-hydroxymyristoyl/3-hydroxydecanoyl-(acyl carrier protein) dehydratase
LNAQHPRRGGAPVQPALAQSLPPQAQPLLSPRDLEAPLVWLDGRPISAALFLAQALALAARLPAQGRPVNLCQNRYHFALALAAALLRGHTSWLPPNALPQTLRSLHEDPSPGAGPAYALTDGAELDLGALPGVFVKPEPMAGVHEVPLVATDLEAVRLLTSGSTGAPQPHAKRWGSLVLNVGAGAQRLAQLVTQHPGQTGAGAAADLSGWTLVATVPAQHSYGLESSVLLALLGGASFDGGRPFFPADVAAALARAPLPRALVTTPYHLKTLLRAGVPLPPTPLTLSATAELTPQLAAQAEQVLQTRVIEIYGCTEAGQVASRRTTDGPLWQTLGDLRVQARAGAAPGEATYWVSGGHVGAGTPLGDVLELADAQHFRLLGRANDLIHVAGKRSSLAHLNFHLNRVAGVEDGAMWLPPGPADSVVRPVAFVVAPSLTARQVVAGLRSGLEPQFVPRRVVFVEALPREATGKLTAQALHGLAQRWLAQEPDPTTEGGAAAAPALVAPPAPTSTAPSPPALQQHPDGGVSLCWPVASDHPAFAGHFPGRPLLPGAVLLALVEETLSLADDLLAHVGGRAAPHRLENVKFLAPVGPGDLVCVVLRAQGARVAFELTGQRGSAQPTVVARGQLAPEVMP